MSEWTKEDLINELQKLVKDKIESYNQDEINKFTAGNQFIIIKFVKDRVVLDEASERHFNI